MADSLENQVLGVAISMLILPIPFVFMRLFARRLKKVGMGLDDWVLIFALVWQIANCTVLIVATTKGNLGHHEIIGPDHLPVVTPAHQLAFKMQYTSQILALVAAGSTKISLLLLYRRIFAYRTFQIITMVWMGVILCWIFGFAFASIFQCSPIDTFWMSPLAEATPGKCVDIYSLYLSTAITGLLTDIMVLALPVPAVMKLQLPTAKKVSVAFVFLLGCIVLVFGGIRIHVFFEIINQTAQSLDLSYLFPKTFYWTLAETSVGIVCACLPTIVPVFNPKIKGSITHSLASIPLLQRSIASRSGVDIRTGETTGSKVSKRSGSASMYSQEKEETVYSGMPAGSRWTAESVPSESRQGSYHLTEQGIRVKQDVYVNSV